MYVLDDALELRGPLRPGVDQVHGSVEVLHIFTVHLHKRSQLLQDVSNARFGVPAENTAIQHFNGELKTQNLVKRRQITVSAPLLNQIKDFIQYIQMKRGDCRLLVLLTRCLNVHKDDTRIFF